MSSFDVAVVGSGFAGTILARALNQAGRRVVVLERGRHPRFAVGESSTPLAAIALERLAARYQLPDLDRFAAYGRWLSSFPRVRRGLKRGFSFYQQRPGTLLVPSPQTRLLVAASPDDAVADTHWLRADVDAFLVARACDEGVEVHQGCVVQTVDERRSGVRLLAERSGERFEIDARFVVDASGPAAVVARSLGAEETPEPARFRSGIVFSHFAGVGGLEELWRVRGVEPEPGPYPDEKAAVHHLLPDGWMYLLPFDHDCVSAGLVVDGGGDSRDPEAMWRETLSSYPTLAGQFEAARPLRPLVKVDRLQYRLSRAAGARWAALPNSYAFFDPMYSTGIAWSLLAVERLARLLSRGADQPEGGELLDYQRLLELEAAQMERLLYGSYLTRGDFRSFVAHSQLYFALVSYEEVKQRLFGEPRDSGRFSFLGAGDAWAERLLAEAVTRLEAAAQTKAGRSAELSEGFERWVREAIAARNVAGLADPARRNLYPVDLDVLVERADLLGLGSDEMRRLLPRLRGRVED